MLVDALLLALLLGSPSNLVSWVSMVGYGDYNRVYREYEVDLLSQKRFQVPKALVLS